MKRGHKTKLAEKIQSMTAKEIVLTMVESLRNPVTKINMDSWGHKTDNICYGCAATNTICKLGGFNPIDVLPTTRFLKPVYSAFFIIEYFEAAINQLRIGDIDGYNDYADMGGFALLPFNPKLPYLDNDFTEGQLKEYEYFANTL